LFEVSVLLLVIATTGLVIILDTTCNGDVGVTVPIPTYPFCKTDRPVEPPAVKPPANVEVAVVEVAVIYATVGLVEALIVVPLDESHPCPNEV
jgi:hypothetical protein